MVVKRGVNYTQMLPMARHFRGTGVPPTTSTRLLWNTSDSCNTLSAPGSFAPDRATTRIKHPFQSAYRHLQ
jgi:hypothetical protein